MELLDYNLNIGRWMHLINALEVRTVAMIERGDLQWCGASTWYVDGQLSDPATIVELLVVVFRLVRFG